MKRILALVIIIISLVTPSTFADEPVIKLEIATVDYPRTLSMGQELSLIITLDYDLVTPAYGFIIVAQFETERDTFEGLQMDKMWDEHKPSELPRTHIGRTWKTAGREGYENFTLQFPIPTYLIGEATIVLDTYSVVWDEDRTSKPCNIDKLCFTKEIPITVIPQEDEEDWGLVVNGGFELGALGWRIVGHNMTIKVGNDIGYSGKGLEVIQSKQSGGTSLSSGMMQIIDKPITPELNFSFKTKAFMPISATGQNITLEMADKIITPGTLTQVSLQFGDTYRINYIITENPDDIYYREKLENEVNIVVAEPTSDWQFIERNVTDDFYNNFGALKKFDNISIIIEQASISSTPPKADFDDLSLYELIIINKSTPTPTITPTIKPLPTELPSTTNETTISEQLDTGSNNSAPFTSFIYVLRNTFGQNYIFLPIFGILGVIVLFAFFAFRQGLITRAPKKKSSPKKKKEAILAPIRREIASKPPTQKELLAELEEMYRSGKIKDIAYNRLKKKYEAEKQWE
jgi:hypothetical protein